MFYLDTSKNLILKNIEWEQNDVTDRNFFIHFKFNQLFNTQFKLLFSKDQLLYASELTDFTISVCSFHLNRMNKDGFIFYDFFLLNDYVDLAKIVSSANVIVENCVWESNVMIICPFFYSFIYLIYVFIY